MSHFPKVLGLVLVGASMVLSAGCDHFIFLGTFRIHTWTQEEDQVLGTQLFSDPYRGYSGQVRSSIERRYGYGSVSGTTDGNGEAVRTGLSVSNWWTFWNTDGPCAGQVTSDSYVPNGRVDLKCRVYTGYNRSQYTPVGMESETYDSTGWSVPRPDDLGTNFLWPGQEMGPHQALRSGNGDYSLVLLDDGDLIQVFNGSETRWETGTSGGVHLSMQGDGNLVLYNSGWGVLWASNTAGNPGAYLNVQDDGNLVVYSSSDQPLWSLW